MKLRDASSASIRELWDGVEPELRAAQHLENAAQALTHKVYDTFSEGVVLARVFVTVPFGDLPEANQEFVRNLAGDAAGELKASTPVLSLIGTYGEKKPWQDRRTSKGHVGIPLISSSFVGAIPMIARLLRELGVPVEWVDSHDTDIVKRKLGDSAGLFFVEDAGTATDHQNRRIIAAQDFVKENDVKSVLGIGGAYFGGAIVTLIMFCRESLPRTSTGKFLPLINFFKSATTNLSSPKRVFSN
jgi:hypothetical protein